MQKRLARSFRPARKLPSVGDQTPIDAKVDQLTGLVDQFETHGTHTARTDLLLEALVKKRTVASVAVPDRHSLPPRESKDLALALVQALQMWSNERYGRFLLQAKPAELTEGRVECCSND